jgi:hypothetical protein
MKNLITGTVIFLTVGAITLVACNKDKDLNSVNNEQDTFVPLLKRSYDLEGSLNTEATRVAFQLRNADYNLAINATSNYGTYPANLQSAVIFGGFTQQELNLSINNYTYNAADNGGWFRPGAEFSTFYDKDLTIKMWNDNGPSIETVTHFPKLISFKKLGVANDLNINRIGNNLVWEKDIANTTGKVVLSYKCYSNETLGEIVGQLSTGVIVLDDNGSYNIDHLLSNKEIKRVELELGRGNGTSFDDSEKGNTFFNIKSSDFHEYIVN